MGTREFLSKLDLDQLRHAKDLVGELLAEREQEQKKPVWCVSDRDMQLKTFSSEGYLQAAEFLVAQARENAASKVPMRPRDMELHLSAAMVPASEYDEWVDVHVEPAASAELGEPMTLPAAPALGLGFLPE